MRNTLNPVYGLYERGGRPFCSSRQVAGTFHKRHDNVLRDIQMLDCSEGFRLLNFEESSYLNDQRRRQPEILMTKDGFVFLVMGYRGKKAAAFKEAYIARFNAMEAFLQDLAAARLEFPDFSGAVAAAHGGEASPWHFSNELNMINTIVLGVNTKEFRRLQGLEKGESIRPKLSARQIRAIAYLQRADIGLLAAIPDYQARKLFLNRLYLERFESF